MEVEGGIWLLPDFLCCPHHTVCCVTPLEFFILLESCSYRTEDLLFYLRLGFSGPSNPL
jgi:hypothetical protein